MANKTASQLAERLCAIARKADGMSVVLAVVDHEAGEIITQAVRTNAITCEDAARSLLVDTLEARNQSPDCECCRRAAYRLNLALTALSVDDTRPAEGLH